MTHPYQMRPDRTTAEQSAGVIKLRAALAHDNTIYVVHRDSYHADNAHTITVYGARREGFQDFTGACATLTGWSWNSKTSTLRCAGETLDDAIDALAERLNCEWSLLVPEGASHED